MAFMCCRERRSCARLCWYTFIELSSFEFWFRLTPLLLAFSFIRAELSSKISVFCSKSDSNFACFSIEKIGSGIAYLFVNQVVDFVLALLSVLLAYCGFHSSHHYVLALSLNAFYFSLTNCVLFSCAFSDFNWSMTSLVLSISCLRLITYLISLILANLVLSLSRSSFMFAIIFW